MCSRLWRLALLVLYLLHSTLTSALAQSATGPSSELRWGGDAEGGAPFVSADPTRPSGVVGFEADRKSTRLNSSHT